MAADLSGNFDYNSLRSALKENGVKNKFLNTALERVASDNGVKDPKELDKSKRVQISHSIFEKYATPPAEETLEVYNQIDGIIEDDKKEKLPEIFNDDEYEVAEYDDYYNFQTPEASNNKIVLNNKATAPVDSNSKANKGINFEQFKDSFSDMLLEGALGNENAQNEFLKQIFNISDVNSDQLLDKTELSGAFYTADIMKGKNYNSFGQDIPKEDDNLLGDDLMQMDMSGDSFNPQG